MTQKYLKIQSTVNVNVTGGLKHLDMTDVNSNVADKLKVQAMWPKTLVRIATGTSYYPVEIKEWKTVQSLEKARLITIGEIVEELPEGIDEVEMNFIMSNFTKLKEGKDEVKRQSDALGKVIKESKEKDIPKLSDINL